MNFCFKTKAKTRGLAHREESFKLNQRLARYGYKSFKLTQNVVSPQRALLLGTPRPKTQDFKVKPFRIRARKLLLGRWSSVTSDQKRRNHYYVRELENILLKSYSTSTRCQRPELNRLKRQNGLKHFGFHQMLLNCNLRKTQKKLGTVTRVRNRCVLSGRGHTLRRLGLSRICFRTLAGRGFIPGLKKI